MNVVLAISEVTGLVKTGGLADVGKALSEQLAQQGHQVAVFMPYYKALTELPELANLQCLEMHQPLLSKQQIYQFNVLRTRWHDVDLYLIDYPEYFQRDGLYNDQYQAFDDNGERFSFFSGAILHSIIHLGLGADIIHCHDWHTAVLPFLLKHNHAPCFKQTKSIITIHNAAYQGIYHIDSIPFLRHHPKILSEVHGGYINMLKMGLEYANKITTVSPSYANELLTPLGSHGLDDVLVKRREDLSGILNGCDYSAWDPMTDPYIKSHYNSQTLSGKAECKQDLQSCFGLDEQADIPVLGMVCRLTEQKGFDYLFPIVSELMQHKVQLVIAGTGDPSLCMGLNTLVEQYSNQLGFFNGFSEEMAHKIEAGSDYFLMPSQFEPCGLNQMYSLAYGTLPIVRAVGGLRDTVVDIHEQAENATGVVFYEPTADALLSCIRRALLFYHEYPNTFIEVQKRGMATQFTWQTSCAQYEQLYAELQQP